MSWQLHWFSVFTVWIYFHHKRQVEIDEEADREANNSSGIADVEREEDTVKDQSRIGSQAR